MTNRPKAWLAAVLAAFTPLGFLYVGRWNWAILNLVIVLTIAGCLLAFPIIPAALQVLVMWGYSGVCARIAYLEAARFDSNRIRPSYSRWYGLLIAGILMCTLLIGVRAFLVEPFSLPAGSMAPTFQPGAKVIVKKWGYGNYASFGFRLWHAVPSAAINRGDIIVFEYPPDPSRSYIKRLVGLPGDTVAYLNKRLTINGVAVPKTEVPDYYDEQTMRYFKQFEEVLGDTKYRLLNDAERPAFVPGADQFPGREGCSYTVDGLTCNVPVDRYFMLGDSRDNSLDSRYWGFVPSDHFIGKVIYVFQ